MAVGIVAGFQGYVLVAAVCIIVIISLLWYKFAYSPYQVFKKLGVPNPPITPFIGNGALLDKLGIKAHYKWVKEYGKVVGYYVGAKPIMIIADPDMVKEVTVKYFDYFVERLEPSQLVKEIRVKNDLPRSILFMSEDDWRRIRPIISPTFSAKKLKLMVPLVERSIASLVKKFGLIAEEGHSVDVWSVYGQFSMETILATLFGCQISILLKGEGNALTEAAMGTFSNVNRRYFILSHIISSQVPFILPFCGIFFNETVKLVKDYSCLRDVVLQLIEQRQKLTEAEKSVDLLQLLIDARSEEEEGSNLPVKRLTNGEVLAVSIDFLLAGYESTSDLLAFTCYLLAMNPDKQVKLHQEIKDYYAEHEGASLYDAAHEIEYVDWVVHEALRMYPPVPRTGRHCKKTCVINGVTIPAGMDVELFCQHIQNSPDYWDQPEMFRPERFSPEEKEGRHPLLYFPFGWGPRNCVGLRFAYMEAKMCVLSVLTNFKFERTPETEVPLQTKIGLTQSPLNGVYLKVVPNV